MFEPDITSTLDNVDPVILAALQTSHANNCKLTGVSFTPDKANLLHRCYLSKSKTTTLIVWSLTTMGGAQKRRLSSDEEETLDQIESRRGGGGRSPMPPRAQRRSFPSIAAGTQPSRRDEIENLVAAHDARHPDVRNHPSTTEVNNQARTVLGNHLDRSDSASNPPMQRANAGYAIGNRGLGELQESTKSLRISPLLLSGSSSLAQSSASSQAAGGLNSRKRRKLAGLSATRDTKPKTRMRATAKRITRAVRSSRKVPKTSSTSPPETFGDSEDEHADKDQYANVAKLFLKVARPPGDWGNRPASRRFPPSSVSRVTGATTTTTVKNTVREFQEKEQKKYLKYLNMNSEKPTTRLSELSENELYGTQLEHSFKGEQATGLIEDDTPTSSGKWTGLDYAKAPISDMSEIFENIVAACVDEDGPCKLATCLHELQGRTLRIGTMCSGTESPIIALKMINEALKRIGIPEISFQHVMSWENVPWKQAYIQRNFNVDVLFRDVTEITKSNIVGGFATTAFGSRVRIPRNLDVVIAGSSCVDFSLLNSSKKTLDEGGESARTFDGVVRYASLYKPKLMILENVKTAPWKTFAKVFEDIGYETVVGWMDSKDFYIPHTRERGYFVGILKESAAEAGLNPASACADWGEAIASLRRRASSPFTDFILRHDDPMLYDARRRFAVSGLLDSDTKKIPWEKCLQRHMMIRGEFNLGDKKPWTHWQKNGSCSFVDSGWVNYIKNFVERLLDTLDINLLRAASERDYDISYKW